MRWIEFLKLFLSVLNCSVCGNQREKSLAFATTPKRTISVARLTVDPYVQPFFYDSGWL